MAYVEDNVVVVKLTENETDVQAAKLRSSTVEDHSLANRHSCSTSAETRDRKEVLYHAAHFGGLQDGYEYDQSDLLDVIILLKVIVSLFC